MREKQLPHDLIVPSIDRGCAPTGRERSERSVLPIASSAASGFSDVPSNRRNDSKPELAPSGTSIAASAAASGCATCHFLKASLSECHDSQ